jgi:hypothetical protein
MPVNRHPPLQSSLLFTAQLNLPTRIPSNRILQRPTEQENLANLPIAMRVKVRIKDLVKDLPMLNRHRRLLTKEGLFPHLIA